MLQPTPYTMHNTQQAQQRQNSTERREMTKLPFPICRLVFSIVELRLTFDNNPKQNLLLLFEGSVNPSTNTLVEDA